MSLFLSSGAQEGVLRGKGGRAGAAILLSGSSPFCGRARVEAALSCGRGFPEWSWRRSSSRAETLKMGQSPALTGGARVCCWPHLTAGLRRTPVPDGPGSFPEGARPPCPAGPGFRVTFKSSCGRIQ